MERIQYLFGTGKQEGNSFIVSLDIHDSNIYTVILEKETGALLFDNNVLGGYPSVIKQLKKHNLPKDDTVVIFEAGGHGFYPHRLFTQHGYVCKMIAPHSIPQKNRQKTDRIDALENIKDCLSGNLRYVWVPTPEVVSARDVLRARYRTVDLIRKKKQYILAFVKRSGCFYTAGKTNWTKRHMEWLGSLSLDPVSRELLSMELDALSELEGRVVRLEKILASFFASHPLYQQQLQALQSIRGFGPINSMTIMLEGGDFNRFSHPSKVMSYAGLVPGLSASGTSNPRMSITKAGNRYFRTAFVCAAKMYQDHRYLYSKKQMALLPQPLQEFIIRCQHRLYTRYRALRSEGKHTNKARCAIARELCAFIWEFAVKHQMFLQPLALAA